MDDKEHEHEDTNKAQTTQDKQRMDEGDLGFPQISGKQKDDEEPKTTDCPEVGQINKQQQTTIIS
eukprot:13063990-Heterocapsa_arctica.AAC.1